MTHIQMQNYKNHVTYVSYIHISHTKHTVLDLFNIYSTMHHYTKVDRNLKTICIL